MKKNLNILLTLIVAAFPFSQPARAENLFYEPRTIDQLLTRNLFSPQAVFTINTTADAPDAIPGDGVCDEGGGDCTLRAAIQEANAFAGANQIDFGIGGGCPQTMSLNSPLPEITDTVTINGYSQPQALPNTAATGSNALICIQILGNGLGSSADGLRIAATAPNTIIKGLAIGNFGDSGIEASGSGSVIEGNFVGTDWTGNSARPNFNGISVGGSNVRVGGSTLPARNIVSANTRYGVALGGANHFVQNNQIGLTATSTALGNGNSGVLIFQSGGNTIGGANSNVRNIISANGTSIAGGFDGSGVYVLGNNISQSPNNTIQGNYIGTNPAGAAAISNQTNGINVSGAINTTVTGNLVSGNAVDGIGIGGAGATGNIVKGNTVGLDATQTNALGNARDGIVVFGVPGNRVGGTGDGDGNRVGGNVRYGIFVGGTNGENNLVQGNFVGYNSSGTARAQQIGIFINAFNNTVGGTAAGARNFASGNTSSNIAVIDGGTNTIQGNYVGLNRLGAVVTATTANGIFLRDTTNNIVGGTGAGAGNVVSGNVAGINIAANSSATTGNQIAGNFVGTNPDGTTAIANQIGIILQNANNNFIGGTTTAARNLVSGNTNTGISLSNSGGNSVQGNYVGTKADGLTALANAVGISVSGSNSTNNVIGGTGAGAGNLVSGNNSAGVVFDGNAANNRLEGSVIGLKADGSAALPNLTGVSSVFSANNNVIGGTAAGAGNVISGNTNNGVLLSAGTNATRVEGNKIGTDATGTIDLGNGQRGVEIAEGGPVGTVTFGNTVGGTTAAARNIISGNNNGGVHIAGASTTTNTIAGNYIGTNAAGTAGLPNLTYGIRIESPNNTVGGATAAYRNVVSATSVNSDGTGIDIIGSGTGTLIQNNYIGTNAAGDAALGNFANIVAAAANFTIDSNVVCNGLFGINIGAVGSGFVTNNRIGTNAAGTALLGNTYPVYLNNSSNIRIGEDAGGSVAPNIIAGGGENGIAIFGNGTGNLIRQNSIYDNGKLGIDLGDNGVTQNDSGDTDFANNYQNFPIINNAMTTINGSLNSQPNRSYRIEFYTSPSADSSGYGEGRTFITSTNVTTDGAGNAVFSIPNPIAVGGFISSTATDLTTRDTSEFSALKQVLAPTAVRFAGGRATQYKDGVLLEWQTGFETDNLGFNVYREQNGKRELVTDSLVAGSALLTQAKLQSGFEYKWFDKDGADGANYYIEAVDLDGSKETFGAFQIESTFASKNYFANSPTIPELNKSDAQKTVAVEPSAKVPTKPTAEQIAAQNTLANSEGVRLSIKNSGFYRVSAAELYANGLPQRVNANNLALFADGIEQPINVVSSESGALEAVEFYGIGIESTETAVRNYQLVVSNRPGRRIEKFDASGATSDAASYTATVERADRTSYFSGLLNGDEENFFGAVINGSGIDQTITISNLAPVAQPVEFFIKLQGLTDSQHNVRVELNGQYVNQISFAARLKGVLETSIPANLLREGANTIRLIPNGANDLSLVETIRVSYAKKFRAENNRLRFTADSNQEITVEGFTAKSVRVFDVTDANNIYEMNAQTSENAVISDTAQTKRGEIKDADERSYNLAVTPVGGGKRTLLAVADVAPVADIERNFASNLRKIRGAELVIITERGFFPSLEPLAKLRQGQNLSVLTVDAQDIYDEFNFGQKSTKAVKDFLKSATEDWMRKPRYVIFAGDATYDPKNYLGGISEILPTRLVDTLTMETASDEWFGDFDGDDVAEFAIGRLPASSPSEMEAIVRKLIAYERQNPSNSAAFVSDESDGFDFAGANAAVREILPNGFDAVDLRRGEMNDATVRNNLLNAINGGQKIVSYAGHGSSNLWRGSIFTRTDADNLTNANHLPVFVTMTCLNGFFQDPFGASLSEALLKNPRGGAIAVWTATGAGLPDSYGSLNVELHRQILSGATLGQAHLQAKRAVTNRDILKTWILLGDPSMHLR